MGFNILKSIKKQNAFTGGFFKEFRMSKSVCKFVTKGL